MWKGRFDTETSGTLQSYGESISFDARLYDQDIRGSIAHARALWKAGILTEGEFQSIERGLVEIRRDIVGGRFPFSVQLEDIHMNIEAELTKRIGDAGAKLHSGRSRNDQVATDLRLYLRETAEFLRQKIALLQEALVLQAEQNQAVWIPGYTHLQRAQPVGLAHHLLAYVEMFQRDKERLTDCASRLNYCPLGSGAIAGSTICLDREAIAEELGFFRVTRNSMDAVGDRDFACEYLAVLAILGMHISRLSEDAILWASSEFGFLMLSDAHTTGSSLMPQKKNPDIAELARGKTGRLYGNLIALLTTCKGLPLTYNRDLQEDKEPLFDSIDTASNTLAIFTEMFRDARFDASRCAEAVGDPLLLATDLADLLVRKGVPFRKAHEKVGKLVGLSVSRGVPLDQLDAATLQAEVPEIAEEFSQVFDLETAMKSRRAMGAPSPERMMEQIDWWKEFLAAEITF